METPLAFLTHNFNRKERRWRYILNRQTNMKKELLYKSKIMDTIPVTLVIGRYVKNGSLYVGLRKKPDEYGDDFFGDITVNLTGTVPVHCAYVDTNNLSGVLPFLKQYNLATPLPFVGTSGYCTYPLFQFDMEKLREYAPEDVETYLKAPLNKASEV